MRPSRHFVFVAFFVVLDVFVLSITASRAQERFEVGGHVAVARSGEFDATDVGVGGRFAWKPVEAIGAEAEVTFYPSDFPDRASFSRSRIEGLFGVTLGPRLAGFRPFAKLRPGFVEFRGQPVVCILIYPPPLSCQLAGGRTVFALDAGGGLEFFAGATTFIRIDAGDRLLKYPGPSFRRGRAAQDSFFSHDVRMSAGAGVRF